MIAARPQLISREVPVTVLSLAANFINQDIRIERSDDVMVVVCNFGPKDLSYHNRMCLCNLYAYANETYNKIGPEIHKTTLNFLALPLLNSPPQTLCHGWLKVAVASDEAAPRQVSTE